MMTSTHKVEAVLHHTPDDRFFELGPDTQTKADDANDLHRSGGASLTATARIQREIIRIRYASTTSCCCSIRASRHGSRLRLELVNEDEDDFIDETATLPDAVPTQGKILDWLMPLRTRCGEPYTIPTIVPTLTEAEAATFIQLGSETYPDLSRLPRRHLATSFIGVRHEASDNAK